MKLCFKCKQHKLIEMFYAHPKMGHQGKCKECAKADSREYRHRKTLDPAWRLSERQRIRLKTRVARAAGKGMNKNRRMALYGVKYPEKARATRIVRHAVEQGTLLRQPCERCRALKTHAHHDDYSKPLDVRWLCIQHHADHHVAMREAELLKQIVSTTHP